MSRFYRFISLMLLTCVVMGAFISCDEFDLLPKESEQPRESSSVADKQESVTEEKTEEETEEEKEEPDPLAKIISISLSRYKGTCTFYWGDRNGSQFGKTLTGVTRFLYKSKKAKIYAEISVASISSSSDGTGVSIKEGDELTHVIVVFQKGYTLTEHDKNVLKELNIGYMFEK